VNAVATGVERCFQARALISKPLASDVVKAGVAGGRPCGMSRLLAGRGMMPPVVRNRTASMKLSPWRRWTKSMTSPCAPQPKQVKRSGTPATDRDGVESSWKGQQPVKPYPVARSCTPAARTTSSIGKFARIAAASMVPGVALAAVPASLRFGWPVLAWVAAGRRGRRRRWPTCGCRSA